MNTELISKINEVVRIPRDPGDFPEHEDAPGLYMGNWENEHGECGSTRCIAGWGINLTTGKPVFAYEDGELGLHPATTALAARLGVNLRQTSSQIIEDTADRLLELDGNTSVLYTNESTALAWLEEHSRPEVG